jgi:hypothetical protein
MEQNKNYGLTLTGLVVSSKVSTFKKKDGTEGHRFEAAVSDGETVYKYVDFILDPTMAPKIPFGEPVQIRCNYARMDESRTVNVGGDLTLLKDSKKSAA